jgi:hypothetical protein
MHLFVVVGLLSRATGQPAAQKTLRHHQQRLRPDGLAEAIGVLVENILSQVVNLFLPILRLFLV